MHRVLFIVPILIMCFQATFANQIAISVSDTAIMDRMGQNLRLALNAWYEESANPIPSQWTRLTLVKGDSIQLDRDHHFLLLRSNRAESQIMGIGVDGPATDFFEAGDEKVLGPFSVILIRSDDSSASIMYKSNNPRRKFLSEKQNPASSAVKINGFEKTGRMTVTSNDERALEFSRVFLEEIAGSIDPGEAAKEAFRQVPSVNTTAVSDQNKPSFNDPVPGTIAGHSDAYEEPWSAVVTFRVVRGSSQSLQKLNGSVRYKNSGNTSDLPVSVSGGRDGGRVTVGGQGDRFSATLNALERNREVSVNSESFIRVPLGGEGFFSFQGVNGVMSGTAYTRRAGRDGVELWFDQQGGDWRQFGVTNSRLRFRNGQTIEVSRSTSSRTSSSSSGPPIIKDIPFIGPGVGSSSSSQSDESYALYITVDLE